MQPAQILRALADLAPAPQERVLDVCRGGQEPHWLTTPERAARDRGVDRLAALDALSHQERVLRRGWVFVIGTLESDGVRRTVRLPLLAEPVRLERGLRGYRVVPAGDLELTGLIEDRAVAGRLESAPGLASGAWLSAAGTAAWIRTAAEAAGLLVTEVVAAPPPRPDAKLVAVASAALYVVRDVRSAGLRDTLLAWADRPGLEHTALARVYGLDGAATGDSESESDGSVVSGTAGPPAGAGAVPAGGPVASPLPLDGTQREAVRRARTEPLVVVSGPPGNGKSHTLVAAALEVVDRGGCVLIAAQSSAAVEALGALAGRYPGPTPVLFGDAERRAAIARELGQGVAEGVDDRRLRADAHAVVIAAARRDAARSAIAAALELERAAAAWTRWMPVAAALEAEVPGPFRTGFPIARARRCAAAARPADGGTSPGDAGHAPAVWWRRGSRALAAWRLRRLTAAARGVPVARILAALDAADAAAASARLAASGGTELGPAWSELAEADDAVAAAVGAAMRNRARSARRWSRAGRRAAAGLAAALQAGRNRRREMLASLDGDALVRALPLWIGTVTDVEDLLPPVPGLFDLVIIDEGVHVDQIRAAPVLGRARRALVAGDPYQLRFVSFVADADAALALQRHGLTALADRLDVRRYSAFDVAAGATPVTMLVRHYRSAPHLIGFSARRFYGDRVALLTRHPRHDGTDLIDVVRVGGSVSDGVNRAEVDAVLRRLRRLIAAGDRDIAVISPFRAQADALESALLAEFSVDQIESLRLRSGTVHAYQGSEADTVIASLGLVDEDSPARRRFVADPNLFNVLITRARRRMVVVTSLTSATGIIGDYLAYAAGPPSPQEPTRVHAQPWARDLGARLGGAGVPVQTGYPVGTWWLDLVAGTGDDAVGLVCAVHPDGVAAHLERQQTLRRAGWRLVDAFASRWGGDAARAAVELATRELPPRDV